MNPNYRDYLLNAPEVNPVARRKFKAVLADVRSKGVPLLVWEVYRSEKTQREYYCQGRTPNQLKKRGFTEEEIANARKNGHTSTKPVITNLLFPKKHGTGKAMDCCFLVNGQPSWEGQESWWKLYESACAAHGLIWGGHWKSFPDKPHAEYVGE